MQPTGARSLPLLEQARSRAEYLRQRLLSQRRELLESAVRLPAGQGEAGREKLDQALLALEQMIRALGDALGEQQENA